MQISIRVHGLSLPVEFTFGPDGKAYARTSQWPGYCGCGEGPEEAARALEMRLEGVCDDAISERRRLDFGRAEVCP